MAKNLKQLLAQIEKLQSQANALKNKERVGVISRIQEAISHYGLTSDELFSKPASKVRGTPAKRVQRTNPTKTTKAAAGVPKYQDATGRTWTGHGKRPAWFVEALTDGKTPESMLIDQSKG